MAEKRRVSVRHKAEPASKKKATTPARTAASAKEKATPVPEPPAEKPVVKLPIKISDNKPLPTVEEPQSPHLAAEEYQSIPESGVLAASLARSRQRWMHEGIFDKFWSKAGKRKAAEPSDRKAPPMARIGSSKLTVEPHIFDIVLFVVKESNPTPHGQQIHLDRPHLQYGPPQYGPQYNHPGTPTPGRSPTPGARPANQYPSPAASNSAQQHHPPPVRAQPPPQQLPPPKPVASQHRPAAPQPAPSPAIPVAQSPQTQAPPTLAPGQQAAPDPVIHMLAQRASTNFELKAVMKIVATGSASPDQLQYFQKHIDELTQIVKARQDAEKASKPAYPPAAPKPTAPQPTTQAAPQQANYGGKPMPSPASSRASTPVNTQPKQQYPLQSIQHYQAPSPAPSHSAPRPKAVTTKPQAEIKHVLIEFAGNTSDRFLFPRHCILEYQPGYTSVLASFLIVHRGSNAATKAKPTKKDKTHAAAVANESTPGKASAPSTPAKPDEPITYDPAFDYYQPITVRLNADSPDTLAVLNRVVAPQDEVRKYMDHIMDNCTRAEYVYLALRLPKEGVDVAAGGEMDIG